MKVEIEYEKSFQIANEMDPSQTPQQRDMTFANLYLENDLINAKMLEKGFADLKLERDQIPIHMKLL